MGMLPKQNKRPLKYHRHDWSVKEKQHVIASPDEIGIW
jgi:hypothetical protein